LVIVVFALHTPPSLVLFLLPAPATTEIYTLSLHDALPISVFPQPVPNHLLVFRPAWHAHAFQSRIVSACAWWCAADFPAKFHNCRCVWSKAAAVTVLRYQSG